VLLIRGRLSATQRRSGDISDPTPDKDHSAKHTAGVMSRLLWLRAQESVEPLGSCRLSLEEPLLAAEEIGRLLAVPRSSIYEYARRPRVSLPALRIGRRLRFSRSDVEPWLDTQRPGALGSSAPWELPSRRVHARSATVVRGNVRGAPLRGVWLRLACRSRTLMRSERTAGAADAVVSAADDTTSRDCADAWSSGRNTTMPSVHQETTEESTLRNETAPRLNNRRFGRTFHEFVP
jgi:excisionase family DNA binding protein